MLSCKANPVLVQCLGSPQPLKPKVLGLSSWIPLWAPAWVLQGLSGSPAPRPGPSTQDMLRESHGGVCLSAPWLWLFLDPNPNDLGRGYRS